MTDPRWCAANGHGVRAGGRTYLHHAGQGAVTTGRDGLGPAVVDGLTWAGMVETWETWLATREAEGLTGPALVTHDPPGPLDGTEPAALPIAQLAGGAYPVDPRRLLARWPGGPGDAPPSARLTWYRPGEHVLALSAEECDHLLAVAGPCREPKVGRLRLAGIPNAGGRAWVHRRIGEVVGIANAVWWRIPGQRTGNIQALEYGPGDEMELHTDASPMFPARSLSALVMLSDPGDYDGGRLEFWHDPTPTTPPAERGTIVVFPATLLHRVKPVTRGKRFSLTAFCESG